MHLEHNWDQNDLRNNQQTDSNTHYCYEFRLIFIDFVFVEAAETLRNELTPIS
jgi:hypothetical protein